MEIRISWKKKTLSINIGKEGLGFQQLPYFSIILEYYGEKGLENAKMLFSI